MDKDKKKWKEKLPQDVYYILWDKGTEPAFSGKFVDKTDDGVYICAGCKNKLFDSSSKFHSIHGWPSFSKPVRSDVVVKKTDLSFGMKRTEVLCASCGGHLGHVFDDGPQPLGKRYCINSRALEFKNREEDKN